MLWRIKYVISSGALIPSPVWGFQTRAFPDFKVERVLLPPNAFSGLTFEVSWIVRNIGKVGNALSTWYDGVYIGKSTNIRSASFEIRSNKKDKFLFIAATTTRAQCFCSSGRHC